MNIENQVGFTFGSLRGDHTLGRQTASGRERDGHRKLLHPADANQDAVSIKSPSKGLPPNDESF